MKSAMKIDEMLSRAKENVENKEAGETTSSQASQRELVSSSEAADIFHTEGEELLLYASKASEKDKLASTLGDGDVKLIQVSSGKPVVIMHSKHGAMHGDFSMSASSASKMLKIIEIPVKTTSTRGDGGIVLSIEKIRQNTSVVDLINQRVITYEAAAFLWAIIQGKIKHCNVLVVGSGQDRLELLNALSVFIPSNERVAVLNGEVHSTHWTSLDLPFEQAAISAGEMKYNRLVGEMQPRHAKLLHSFNGTLKAMLSMPGNTCSEAMHVLREVSGKAANSIDVVISIHDFDNKQRITEICEAVNGQPRTLYALENDKLVQVKLESELCKQAVYRGFSQKAVEHELESKKHEIENWNKNGNRSSKEIRLAIKKLNY